MPLPLLILSRAIVFLPQFIIRLLMVSPTARLVAIEGVTRAAVQGATSGSRSLPKAKTLSQATIIQYAGVRAKNELRTRKFFNETPWTESPILRQALRQRIRPKVVVAATLLQVGATYMLSFSNGTAVIDDEVEMNTADFGLDVVVPGMKILPPMIASTEERISSLAEWFQGLKQGFMDRIRRALSSFVVLVYRGFRRTLLIS